MNAKATITASMVYIGVLMITAKGGIGKIRDVVSSLSGSD